MADSVSGPCNHALMVVGHVLTPMACHLGTIEYMPIHFMHKSLPFDELCALYAVCTLSHGTSPSCVSGAWRTPGGTTYNCYRVFDSYQIIRR